MRKILIPPRFSQFQKMVRAHAITTITDSLIDQGYLPVMPFAHTSLDNEEEALKVAARYLDDADGVILQGGNDLCPTLYKQENVGAKEIQRYRDLFEMALVKLCLERGVPILGLCRGMQLVNVTLGGTLHQKLPEGEFLKHIDFIDKDVDEFSLENMKECFHDVIFEKDGVLYNAYKKPTMRVNSYHHQGVDRLGEGLRIEARSPDGLVEAFSDQPRRVLGVQWHPELDLTHPENKKLFQLWLDWCM